MITLLLCLFMSMNWLINVEARYANDSGIYQSSSRHTPVRSQLPRFACLSHSSFTARRTIQTHQTHDEGDGAMFGVFDVGKKNCLHPMFMRAIASVRSTMGMRNKLLARLLREAILSDDCAEFVFSSSIKLMNGNDVICWKRKRMWVEDMVFVVVYMGGYRNRVRQVWLAEGDDFCWWLKTKYLFWVARFLLHFYWLVMFGVAIYDVDLKKNINKINIY